MPKQRDRRVTRPGTEWRARPWASAALGPTSALHGPPECCPPPPRGDDVLHYARGRQHLEHR
eukprot:1606997-Alexandrium_andersonii.AAC.1